MRGDRRKMRSKSQLFTPKRVGLLAMRMLLSALMNNLAALVIPIPAAAAIACERKLPPGAVLVSLAFATILGGMTKLIGTPANLILSSVRKDELGEPFLLFSMTPVGGSGALVGFVYLLFIGWRLPPKHVMLSSEHNDNIPVFELGMPMGAAIGKERLADVRVRVRTAGAVVLVADRLCNPALLSDHTPEPRGQCGGIGGTRSRGKCA
jgi:di/tricarboxylate transporter